MSLNNRIEEFLLERGAIGVGFATRETLQGGPPSADMTYRLSEARSVVSFALPLNREYIRTYLSKEDRGAHEEDNISTNIRITNLSWELAGMLKNEGFSAKGTAANLKYRTDVENWERKMHPDVSHRYFAVRSGMGSFGWSGNVGITGFGTAIVLGSTVTDVELEPTEPIPAEKSFCDNCKLCYAACAVGMFEKDKEMSVVLGSVTFTHSARKNKLLCDFCCGGFTGMHKSGKWSTWSPGRFKAPDDDEEIEVELLRAIGLYAKRPTMPGGYVNPALSDVKLNITCGNCQIICWGEKKETAKNLKLLRSSGCVLQKEDGTLFILPPDEAKETFDKMEGGHRALYR